MDFIRKHIEKKMSSFAMHKLTGESAYMVLLNKPIRAGYDGGWKVIGVNNFGHPSMPSEISISWTMIRTKELLDMFFQMKEGEYTIQKYRTR